MTRSISAFIFATVGILAGSHLIGCSSMQVPQWKLATIDSVAIDETEASLVTPSSIMVIGDSVAVIFQARSTSPVILDMKNGRIRGSLLADPCLTDSAMHDENTTEAVLNAAEYKVQRDSGSFDWYERGRTTKYRPVYENGIVIDYPVAVLSTVVQIPLLKYENGRRLEGPAGTVSLTWYDLST